jgi:TolB protein
LWFFTLGTWKRRKRKLKFVRLLGILTMRSLVAILLFPTFIAAQESQRITNLGDFIQHLSWSPDGKSFLLSRIHKGKLGLWTVGMDGASPQQLFPKESNPTFDGSWSPDGQRIVFVYDRLEGTDGKLQIDTAQPDGSDRKNLLPHAAFDESPRWSPDGKFVAFVSTRGKNQDIWTMDSQGKNLKQLTSDTAADNSPAWSPDGKHLAFTSGRSGNFEIWSMNADGSDQKKLTDHPRMDYWPVWSPEGKHIAFTSNRDGNYEIYVMDADGKNVRNISNHPASDNFAAWSPDGRRLAWISNRAGSYDVHVVDMK